MTNAAQELDKCSAKLRLIEGEMTSNGFTRKQIDLLREYIMTAEELSLWAGATAREQKLMEIPE